MHRPAIALIGGMTGVVIVIATLICVVLLRSFPGAALTRDHATSTSPPRSGTTTSRLRFARSG
jgi:hypothetical protein